MLSWLSFKFNFGLVNYTEENSTFFTCNFLCVTFSELPTPSLGDLSDLRSSSAKLRRSKNPNVLCYDYKELCALDTVKVELVPEKKGIILKHVEYEVTSQVRK